MDPDTNQIDMNKALAERFATLPKVVQDAITSADVQKHLRNLAEGHKLHVDQWQVLENNVMLTLLGFQPVAELTQHLQKDLEVTEEVAAELATNISTIVFSPIRSEMEQHLSHPTAVQAAVSDVEAIRAQALQGAAAENTPAPASETVATAPDTAPPAPGAAVVPATPPPPPPQEKAVRAQIAGTYTASKSHERKSIEGDPYREQIS
jgi:hypothetical protein